MVEKLGANSGTWVDVTDVSSGIASACWLRRGGEFIIFQSARPTSRGGGGSPMLPCKAYPRKKAAARVQISGVKTVF